MVGLPLQFPPLDRILLILLSGFESLLLAFPDEIGESDVDWHRAGLHCYLDALLGDVESIEIAHQKIRIAFEHLLHSIGDVTYHLSIC